MSLLFLAFALVRNDENSAPKKKRESGKMEKKKGWEVGSAEKGRPREGDAVGCTMHERRERG